MVKGKTYPKLGDKVLVKVANAVKATVVNMNEGQMYDIMRSHLITMNLMDENGAWVSNRFSEIEEKILPKNMDYKRVAAFIDDMVEIAKRNQYFMHFMQISSSETYPVISEKYKEEGKKILPDVIGYTIILENLTRECANDYEMLEELYNCFKKMRKEKGSFKELPFFHKIKLISVEIPIKSYLKCHHTRIIKPKSGGIAVAINILEATLTDFKSGNRSNAVAGWVLAKHKAGTKVLDKRTGAGPSGWSKDKKAIERVYPFPVQWASLYQTWNMCFVTRFGDFAYILPKLLIPQVADYYSKPNNYIYNRAIALYIYLNFASFDYVEKKKTKEPIIKWRDKKLSLVFGKSNKVMAQMYQEKIRKAKLK